MIALQKRERWAPETRRQARRDRFREVEGKAVRLFRTGVPLISGKRNPQRRKGGPTICAQLDEIRNVPLILVKVTFLRNGQE